MLTLIYGLGTVTLPYATVFLENAPSTFFLFFSFYLLFKTKNEKIIDNKYFFLAGLFSGFAIGIHLSSILIAFGCLIYMLLIKKNKTIIFLLGLFIGIIPLLSYNYSIFGFFCDFTYNSYLEQSIWRVKNEPINGFLIRIGTYGFAFSYQSLNSLARLLVYPERGLFFYYPILILSFIGLFYMYKKYKLEAIIILIIFISVVSFFSLSNTWSGGFSFGPRYLSIISPLLTLPLLFAFKKINIKIILFLMIISIFVNFLSLQYWDTIESEVSQLSQNMLEKFNKFQVLANPLFNHYLPLFLRNGPRSRIFESLLLDSKMDIRNTPHSCGLTPPVLNKTEIPIFSLPSIGIVTLRIQFLSLIFISIVIFLIWRKEILGKINLNFKQKLLSILALVMIFILLFVRLTSFLYEDNWHAPEFHDGKIYESERWMSQNATLLIFNKNSGIKKINLTFDVEAFNKTRNLLIYLNDGLLNSYKINNKDKIIQIMNLKSGVNEIKFYSLERCDRPTELGLRECDLRCLSFKMENIQIFDSSE